MKPFAKFLILLTIYIQPACSYLVFVDQLVIQYRAQRLP